ncbi:MAG TPA: hypothetical protein VMT17_09410 [Anaeromyxobacteraceae bacterium]|nr:hypothetical protein [Anaeromyxobacteraceae bacterium]
MPLDPHAYEEESPSGEELGRRTRFGDFDCPSCDANNPYDEGFGDGDEVLCYYCGQEYEVRVSDDGRLRLRER